MQIPNPVFIPGPTNMPDQIRQAMQIQTIDHRAPDFADKLVPILNDLKKVFKTKTGEVFAFPASGTGGWEAAITNTLSPGDKVLVARYGMFSHRWIDMCQRHNLDVEIIDCRWGDGAPADLFEKRLAEDSAHNIKALLVTHNETATGVRSDIAAVRSAMSQADHPALLYVDCVSSLASMDFRMDEWGIDLAVSGSQKGFMLSTGLAIVAASRKALDAMDSAKCTRCFFDFRDMLMANRNGGYPYTPPIQLFNGLRVSLELLFEEGLENVFARHYRIAEGIRRAVSAWDLKLCANSPDLYSDTVSAIYVPEGLDSNLLTEHAYHKYGVSFGIGLGEMNGKAFRIGHLGAVSDVMALSGLSAIEMAMKDLNFDIDLGSGVAAAQEFYRTPIQVSSTHFLKAG
ncbi:MAG: alanine-glyoxylate transaminase/serine-glyoxylate transaminase/serine-pyruvate transaminase [Gammaproteobacteria bacterium]|jgi:alanine-glyoxylate transaminase/serine-glyoxylate transaminase/serine-pyruvate transaminase